MGWLLVESASREEANALLTSEAAAILQAVLYDRQEFSRGTMPEDDKTLVVIKRKPV